MATMETKDELRYMDLALAEAQIALSKGEIPVGAVIVRDGEILALAHNQREADLDISGHAEIVAMRRAAKILGTWDLSNCSLFVTLEPCPMCAGAIKQARLRSVTFGASDPQFGGVISNHHLFDGPNSPLVYPGVRASEAKEILDRFFKNRRK